MTVVVDAASASKRVASFVVSRGVSSVAGSGDAEVAAVEHGGWLELFFCFCCRFSLLLLLLLAIILNCTVWAIVACQWPMVVNVRSWRN